MNNPLFSIEQIPVKLYNTATRQKEVFIPLQDRQVRMYTCGPTVYHYVHIGNLRTFVFEDLLRRTLKFFGFSVTQAMNLTDVDDKTIKGALSHGISLEAYTQPYKEAFFQDLNTLHIEQVEHYPAATDYITEMIEMIQVLINKGFAYKGGDDSIYYAIKNFPRYGCLSHLKLDELQLGASERVATDEYDKENVADFVLWKSYDAERDGNIYWESPFGPGRPGWHLECSTMAMRLLGETLDIHVGGVDNLFPHHENEVAQSEAYSGKPFVKLWMHAEHLLVEQKKMSKSLGNFYTLRDLLNKGFTGTQVRYMLLQGHYRTQLNFTFQGLEAVKAALQRLNDCIQRLNEVDSVEKMRDQAFDSLIEKSLKRFAESLADDLNISSALAALFDFVHEVNIRYDAGQLNQEEAKAALEFMKKINSVLAIFSFEQELDAIPQNIQEAFDRRQQARQEKNWKLADELRELIQQGGYTIEDTPKGARLKKE